MDKLKGVVTYPAGGLEGVPSEHYHVFAKSMFVVSGPLVDGYPMDLAVVGNNDYDAECKAHKLHPGVNVKVRRANNEDQIFDGKEKINLCNGKKSIFGWE